MPKVGRSSRARSWLLFAFRRAVALATMVTSGLWWAGILLEAVGTLIGDFGKVLFRYAATRKAGTSRCTIFGFYAAGLVCVLALYPARPTRSRPNQSSPHVQGSESLGTSCWDALFLASASPCPEHWVPR